MQTGPALNRTNPCVADEQRVCGNAGNLPASVSGAVPLHFQWQFSSGGGYANIAGANTNMLALTAAITNTGSYELVLTNSYGTATTLRSRLR